MPIQATACCHRHACILRRILAHCHFGRRCAVVLVLGVPDGTDRISEELWLEPKAKRFAVWGSFNKYLVTEIAAKELRAETRGLANCRGGFSTVVAIARGRTTGSVMVTWEAELYCCGRS